MYENVLIMAHRGASGYAPENTLPAFQMAIDMKADGIECDIHLTIDDEFVVCHDDTVDRTSNGQGEIRALTCGYIKSLDFGTKFDAKFTGAQAPTLREMLNVVKNMNPLNIEIKEFGNGDDAKALEEFYAILKEYDILSNTIVSSFDAPLLKLLKQSHPDVYTCLLYSQMRAPAANAEKIGCSAIHPYHARLSKNTVNNAHKRGLKVNCWTANEEKDILRMLKIGVDGIITNYPDRVRRVIDANK